MSDRYFKENFQEEFLYFPYLVVYVLFVYLFCCIFFGFGLDKKKYPNKKRNRDFKKEKQNSNVENDDCCDSMCLLCGKLCCCFCIATRSFFCYFCKCLNFGRPLLYLDSLYASNWGIIGVMFLWLFRTASFIYILYFDLYSVAATEETAKYRFGNWVNIFTCLYFLCSSHISTVGTKNLLVMIRQHADDERPRPQWGCAFERFGVFTLVVYEIAFGNAVFVSVVKLANYSNTYDFQNISQHFVPSAALMLDMVFNQIPFRMEHYYYSLSLPLGYLIFQWVEVYMGNLEWQYTMLETNRATCFRVYTILFAVHVFIYSFLALLHYSRDRCRNIQYEDRHRVPRERGKEEIEYNLDDEFPEYDEEEPPDEYDREIVQFENYEENIEMNRL